MKSPKHRLRRLLVLARKAPGKAPPTTTPAPGFATRVVAHWRDRAAEPPSLAFWTRACWLGAAAAGLICLASAVHQTSLPEPGPYDALLEAPAAMEIY